MKTKVKILIAILMICMLLTSVIFAVTEQDNGIMYIYAVERRTRV